MDVEESWYRRWVFYLFSRICDRNHKIVDKLGWLFSLKFLNFRNSHDKVSHADEEFWFESYLYSRRHLFSRRSALKEVWEVLVTNWYWKRVWKGKWKGQINLVFCNENRLRTNHTAWAFFLNSIFSSEWLNKLVNLTNLKMFTTGKFVTLWRFLFLNGRLVLVDFV